MTFDEAVRQIVRNGVDVNFDYVVSFWGRPQWIVEFRVHNLKVSINKLSNGKDWVSLNDGESIMEDPVSLMYAANLTDKNPKVRSEALKWFQEVMGESQ